MRKIFVAGTDTDIGKTYVSLKLLQEFNHQGLKTIAIKPIATGAINGYNQDALLLQQFSSIKLDYSIINPFAFEPSISPNIAAAYLTVDKILASIQKALNMKADVHLIEGVGGWMTPLNSSETMANLVKKLDAIEIILVVGIKLGCLNHSLLTVRELQRAGVTVLGYVANVVSPDMHYLAENLADLKARLGLPCLAELAWQPEGPTQAACVALAQALLTNLASSTASSAMAAQVL